jgi:uncharacterized membrane protein YdcZ (DUF606 family)
VVLSFLFGIFAEFIFWTKDQRKKQTKIQHVYQFWLNFVGSIAGWLFLYFTIAAFQELGIEKITFIHLTFGVLGIIGVVGLLPTTLVGIVNSVSKIVEKIIKKAWGD